MKPRRKQRTHDHIEIKSPVELFHLARLLEGGINPLTMMVSGGILDLSMDLPPMESSQLRYAVAIFEGVLTSDQIVKVPNLTKWWWVQNTTSGNFTLKMQTPLGVPTAVPRNSGWQLVHCDGKDNIAVSPQNNLPKKFGAREWSGPGRERALTEILDLAGVPFDGRTRTEITFEIDLAVGHALFAQRIRDLRRRKALRKSLGSIAKLSRELLKALNELDDEVFEVCRINRVSVVGLVATLLDVPLRFFSTSQIKRNVSNRPRGSFQNPALRMLVLDLYMSIAEGAKGKLTLYGGKGEAKGTLPAVLEILRPHLPEIIPPKLPYETLRDIRKSAREAQERRSMK
jgi:hypothetical protein